MSIFIRRIRIASLGLVCLAWVCAAGLGPAHEYPQSASASRQDEQPEHQEITNQGFRIKVDAALVTTDVMVVGAPVADIKAEDFTVHDNGVIQQINHFSRERYPLAVALLIDRSDSVSRHLPALQIAALSALRRLRPEDRVALFSLEKTPEKLHDLTGDRMAIADKIGALTAGSATNIYGSIHDAARYLALNAPGFRRAVVLVSDNCNSVTGKHNADSARVAMLEASATLFGIKTSGSYCPESIERVEWIASETGGEILDVHASASLQTALSKTMSDLRLQYTLGFNPSNPGEIGSFHKLDISIAEHRCPGCRVLARAGYYTGISAPLPRSGDLPPASTDSEAETDQALLQRSIYTAAVSGLDLADIPFTVRTSEQTDSQKRPQLKLDIQIEAGGISFAAFEGRRSCRFYVALFYADAKGKIISSDWKTLKGSFDEEAYGRILKEGIPISFVILKKPKGRAIKIVVYDEGSSRVGSRLVRLP